MVSQPDLLAQTGALTVLATANALAIPVTINPGENVW